MADVENRGMLWEHRRQTAGGMNRCLVESVG